MNMPHGQGIHTWPDGRKYTGSFREGKRHDRGLMIYQDGTVVAGRWKNDVYQETIPDVPVLAYSFLIGGIIIAIIMFAAFNEAGIIPGVMVLAGGAACWAVFLLLDELINRLTEIKYYLAKENKREDS